MEAKGEFTVGKGALIPKDERAREIMTRLAIGDRVLVHIHRARNVEHNALAHAVFTRIADAIGVPMDTVKLWLKYETGYVDAIKLPNGRHVASPKSMRFESMSQDEFQAFWNQAWPIICEKIVPGMPKAVVDELKAIVDGRTA